MSGVRILTARWVFPVAGHPIPDGAVGIHAGRIAAVGRRADVAAACPAGQLWDLGESALLPGLVNCHAHLEIGPLPSAPPTESFVPWVLRVIEARKVTPFEAQARVAEAGARALLRSGTTSVGEVSTTGRSLTPLLRVGLRGVVYREILGLAPAEASERANAGRADMLAMSAAARDSRLAIGVSPHSPYALSEELLSACGDLVRKSGVSPAIHAAESPAETEFLATGGGPIADRLYPAVGCPSPPPHRRARSPIAYLADVGVLRWRPLLIHAVHADEADCRTMAQHGARVVHCPRSNRRLSEGTAPIPLFLTQGIPVGLGTDSLASAPSLDLWAEMRAALVAHAGRLSPEAVLEMGTLGGARALGIADRVGSLELGKRADVIAVDARRVAAADPIGSLLEETRGEDVLLVLIDGEMCHNRIEVVTCA
jgi:5-methylthioadenosine/S-adenosylhomocysteine deaminase